MDFWDRFAFIYDVFERGFNYKVNRNFPKMVAELVDDGDKVLECACGTGLITRQAAVRAGEYIAADLSAGMLREAKKRCAHLDNIKFGRSDIMHINAKDGIFDKVIAGNVIHIVSDPQKAFDELYRVCRKGGTVIIPTYVSKQKAPASALMSIFNRMGAHFRETFDGQSYRKFIDSFGYETEYIYVDGFMPNMIAVIRKK